MTRIDENEAKGRERGLPPTFHLIRNGPSCMGRSETSARAYQPPPPPSAVPIAWNTCVAPDVPDSMIGGGEQERDDDGQGAEKGLHGCLLLLALASPQRAGRAAHLGEA
jgi:hypothetical protein